MRRIFLLLIPALILFISCEPITSFNECVEAGNPVMESYPRKCTANGQTFIEVIKKSEFHRCTTEQQACTKEYQPVCALVDNGIRCITIPCQSTDAIDYANACTACADKALGYYPGICIDQLFVVCEETTTGFSAQDFAAENEGICVEICPGNYDPYITQIGVELCIKHYGIDEIEQWQICTHASDSCDCVKAYETTSGDQIPNTQYRCVPVRYAERLLFRAGIDRLDENGKSSVVIA